MINVLQNQEGKHTLLKIIHNDELALSILCDTTLVETFNKVISSAYTLGKIDMKDSLKKPNEN